MRRICRRISSPMRSGFSSRPCSSSTLKNRFVRLIRWRFPLPFYTKRMACAICETRRPRRFCPGVRGEICSLCCGTEREVSVSCPLDCEYLRDARKHDKPLEFDEAQLPNRDIQVTDRFLEEHEDLIMFLGSVVATGAFETDGAVDFDVREALEALVRTYRTLQSG